ncbi:MAG: transposase [Candidatus Omnitrophota bacterium]
MPRPSRAFLNPGCYHVITRGNQKQKTFRDKNDFAVYLSMLKRAKRKHGIRLYAYCLMENHVHLLIDIDHARIMSKFMHSINLGYTAYYNAKYATVGHLWQGRFKSKPILKGGYLIHCANYIEHNPMRAGVIDDIANYPWSSYKERCLMASKIMVDEIRVGTFLNIDTGTLSGLEL